jgi:chaperonin GroEL
VALLRSIKAIEKIRTDNDVQETGVDILRKAQSWPARQIALINAGDDGSVVAGKILGKERYNFGYDAQSGEYGNLVTKRIMPRLAYCQPERRRATLPPRLKLRMPWGDR